MNIWKAELILFKNDKDEYETIFSFKMQNEKYKSNESQDEWIHANGWICNRIPMKITIERIYNLRAVQGFDHKLDETELQELKKAMVIALQEDLDIQKLLYLENYKFKSAVLNKYKLQ